MAFDLFHGSERIIIKPEYGVGKLHNDYGRGFYCTEDFELAAEWAVDVSRDGYVNRYSMDTSGLKMLDLNSSEYTVLHWLAILINNRYFELNSALSREAFRYLSEHFLTDISGYDLIKGYRADDSYFSFAQDFLNNQISISQLNRALKHGDLGEQIMLRSKKAFDRIEYTGSSSVSSAEWFLRKQARDNHARQEYRRMNKENYISGELYMIRIIDEGVEPDDTRL